MIDLTVKIDDTELKKKYASITVYKDVNKIPSATVSILGGVVGEHYFKESSNGIFDPGKKIEIMIGDIKSSIFKGIIIKHRILMDDLSSKLMLECKDKAVALTIARKSRYTNPNEKEVDFIRKTVLEGYAGTINNFEETQKNLMQYDCTDWDFTLSRAEIQGMLVRVSDGEVNIEKPELKESIHTLTYGTNLRTFKGEIDARYQFDDVKSTGWDYQMQKKTTADGTPASLNNTGDLSQEDLSKILGLGAIELQSMGQLEEPELKAWASAQLFKSRMAMVRGTASCEGKDINPMETVTLKGVSTRFNGDVLVTGVRHEIAQGVWTTTIQFGLSPEWFSQSENFHSPLAAGLLPAVQGLQIGKVIAPAHQDPDKQGRIKVSVATIVEGKKGVWARQALFSTGAIFRPVKDDEVVLGFLNDDPRQAIILGVLNNKDALTPVKSTKDVKNEKTAIYAPHNEEKDIYIQFDKKEQSIEIKTKKRSVLLNEVKKEIQLKKH